MKHLLIVGGSDAGISAALRARELDAEVKLTLVLADRFPNFSICGIPYFLSGEVVQADDLAHRKAVDIEAQRIRLLLEHRATRIDPQQRTVDVQRPDGTLETLSYDKLILGTGAVSIKPKLPGIDLPGVFTLRWMDDTLRIHSFLEERLPKTAVIVVGGYIGMEVTESLTRRGIAVTVVGAMPSVMTNLDPDLGSSVGSELSRHGVEVRPGTMVERIIADGSTLRVQGNNGLDQSTHLALVVVGARPETTLGTGAGISTGTKGAFKVNRRMETNLTLWVALCIVAGITLGHFLPRVFQAIGGLEVAEVNLPVAVLIWLMIVPMLLKIDFAALHRVREHWRGVGVTLFVNRAVKPFSMALLARIFIRQVFAPYLPAEQLDSYVAGLIILAAAPCAAMVCVWSHLSGGEPHFTLTQLALNDTIMIFAFAPIVGFLLGLSAITVPWDTLILSAVLYMLIPVAFAHWWRGRLLRAGGEEKLQGVLKTMQPVFLIALLVTLVLLFGFQGEQILSRPLIIVMLAVPILIQVYFNSGLAYLLNRQVGEAHCVAAPSALIGASNFFELAVAAAISLFGFDSGAALATVVGVLVEVPVMLSVVAIANQSKDWYERRAPQT